MFSLSHLHYSLKCPTATSFSVANTACVTSLLLCNVEDSNSCGMMMLFVLVFLKKGELWNHSMDSESRVFFKWRIDWIKVVSHILLREKLEMICLVFYWFVHCAGHTCLISFFFSVTCMNGLLVVWIHKDNKINGCHPPHSCSYGFPPRHNFNGLIINHWFWPKKQLPRPCLR